MKRAARFKTGSVVFDKRRKTWNFLWWNAEGGRRTKTIGTLKQYKTKSAAQRAAQVFVPITEVSKTAIEAPTVEVLIDLYRQEKMPTRYSTRRSYDVWLNGHILPRWRACPLADLQARPVELWLVSLDLAPKSKAHIRGLVQTLWDFAMWSGSVPTQRNPIELVRISGSQQTNAATP